MLHKYWCFCHSEDIRSSKKHYPTVIEELCHHFSLADLRESTNNFNTNQIIGGGGSVALYRGCLKLNDATYYTVALKKQSKHTFEVYKNEIELLCQIRHINLVSLIGFCDHKDEKIIVYEYMPNGSLHNRLHSRDMEPLSWKKRLEICIGAAHGLHYLHTGTKRTIYHRNIKPSNILLDNNMVPKLADFGLSLQGPHFMSKPKTIKTDGAGTIYYIAPEHFTGIITDKCDVYSFGMVLLEVVCARRSQDIDEFLLNRGSPVEGYIDCSLKGKIAPECWEVFINITKQCLNFDPNERPTIAEVELELERGLSLQEEADARNTNGDYVLLYSTTIFDTGRTIERNSSIPSRGILDEDASEASETNVDVEVSSSSSK